MRDWAKSRRERNRHLIELVDLVQKAGLIDLTDDDWATMLGAFLDLADQLRIGREGDDRSPQQLAAGWRLRGLHAFDADAVATGVTQDKNGLMPRKVRGLSGKEEQE